MGLMICEDWSLTIDLKLTNQSTAQWINILRLQNFSLKSENHREFWSADPTAKSRVLSVWVRPDQTNVMLMVASRFTQNSNLTFNITTKFNTGNWINLQMSLIHGVYEIKVDYKQVYNISYISTNSVLRKRRIINLVMGNNNGTRNISAIGYYRNFDIISCQSKIKKLLNLCRVNLA